MSNKYLEKVASLHDAKHLAKATVALAKQNPGASIGGVLGGMNGLSSTTPKRHESKVRVALRGLSNTATGVAVGAVTGKAVEMGMKNIKAKAGVY
jgi:predicted TIM-barrel enzyme